MRHALRVTSTGSRNGKPVGIDEYSVPDYQARMSDVDRVRAWLQSQPFEVRMVTLILLLVETVEAKHGKDASRVFESDMREAYRKIVGHTPGN